MSALTFEKSKSGVPVAVVRGGDNDGDILYLESEGKGVRRSRDVPLFKYEKDLTGVKDKTGLLAAMDDALRSGIHPDKFDEGGVVGKAVYSRAYAAAGRGSTELELPPDSMFQVIPSSDPKTRQIWYVAGISGSGKSYFARNIAENYKKMYPDREVYLISKYKVDEDDTLGKMKLGKPKSISLDSIVEDYPSVDEFHNCLVIFDDYDTLAAPYDKVVQKLIDDLAIRGRHTATSMCVLSHYLTNYKKTRLILGEAHFIVLYPMATSFKAMKYVCEHHCGLTKDEIFALKRLGRWICIHKVFPQYLISAHTARLLNQ